MHLKRLDFFTLLSYSIVIGLFIITINDSFIFDTVYYGSKLADFYYSANFPLRLPDSIDCGYMPTFSVYVALAWKLLGRDLISSHLAMLPFVLGIIWQSGRLIKKFVPPEYKGLALLLLLLDPTLLSQMTLVSPDILLIFFCILALNSILENKQVLISISVLFLFLIHMRGLMISLCLLIIDIYVNISFSNSFKKAVPDLIRRSLIYLPSVLILLAFSYYHYKLKGWILIHDDSPWSVLFQSVSIQRMIFNLGIIGWRIIDFGRFGIWIVFFCLLIKFRMDIFTSAKTKLSALIFSIFLVLLTASVIWARNLLAHRYLLPVYLYFSLLCINILFTHPMDIKFRRTLISIWLIFLISGNFWVYPDKIDKGWDSTLAHLPYNRIRKQALNYLDANQIEFNNVQSFFPNTSVIDFIDLNHDTRFLSNFNDSCDYVIYSNLYSITDAEYDLIKSNYNIIEHFKGGMVYMDLCKRILPKR